MTIGKKIRMLRLQAGLSQTELAPKIGILPSGVSNYENGNRTPGIRELQRIADVFGVDLAFFGLSEPEPVVSVLARAAEVLESPEVPADEKQRLYAEFIKIYEKTTA